MWDMEQNFEKESRMKPSVYLETSLIGCLAMRLSGVLRIAANQQTTRDWWNNHRERFELFVSRYVVDECSDGDPNAAQERLVFLEGIPLLEVSKKPKLLRSHCLVECPCHPKQRSMRITFRWRQFTA